MNTLIKFTHTLKSRFVLAAGLILGAAAAHAHPGHSLSDESALHFVTSPYHLLILALGGVALCGAAVLAKRPASRRILAAGGAVALLAAAALWQMPS